MANNPTETKIKAYLTPILITCFGVVSWNIIVEIRSDVKTLLNANAATAVEVTELKRRIGSVEYQVAERLFAIKPKTIKVEDEKNRAR